MYCILLLKCILSGFFLAVPIGPVNLICIRRTLTEGRLSGLIAGAGAAAADALYGYAAAAGLSILTNFIQHNHAALRWLGGIFIIYLGFRSLYAAPCISINEKQSIQNLTKLFSEVFLLTLANPVTVFAFIAAFSSLGIATLITTLPPIILASLGVWAGSLLWWITLTSIICYFRTKITVTVIMAINRISGLIIILLGIVSIVKF
ncbi:putative membrane protein [Propionispora sp. 2/2-37]|uniref:LysE family translocator n=1 Tax=Propionispora sp. 2/2-37 TaxID=1677858 RepID=UPI0006BB60A1|nr:LysE family transporter [Propionispora sp. 2/2-37]CUH94867.1 putative membrane protein [Propionispora sp. 2/2-37]